MILGPLYRTSNGSFEDFSDLLDAPNSMIQCLLETPDLEASLSTPDGVKEAQLQKLAVNALVNPLTAVFRCKTGQLFDQPPRLALMKALLEETGEIMRATQSQPSQKPGNSSFANETLLALVLRSARRVGAGKSSTLQDIELGRRTEIDYMNGYLVLQAKRLGLPYANNDIIVDMVKQRRVIGNDDIWSAFDMSSQLPASEGLSPVESTLATYSK